MAPADELSLDPLRTFRRPPDGLPWLINICVTSRCNLFCDMCQSATEFQKEAAPERMLRFFARLADWLPRSRPVLFTGGEPLVHEHLPDYLGALAARGFRTMINTNGVLLTPARIGQLADLGLSMVNLSLVGLWDTHDRLRHGPGSFQGALDVMHYLAHHTELETNVIAVIHAQNAAELPELVRVVSERLPRGHVRFQAILPTLAKPWTAEFFRDDPLWPRSPKALETVLTALDQLEALRDAGLPILNPPSQFALWRRYFRDPLHFTTTESCAVGRDAFIVMADGIVTFCHHFGELATIDDDPREVWESAAARQMREAMHSCPRPCNYRVNCCYVEG